MDKKYIIIIVVVFIVLLLLCCCSVAAGIVIYYASSSTSSNTDTKDTTQVDSKSETSYVNGVNVEVYDIEGNGNFKTSKETFVYVGDIWLSDADGAKFFGKYDENFGLKFTGYIKVPVGTHTFIVGHDDGATFTIGDKTQESWKPTEYIEDIKLETISTTEQYMPMELKFFELGGQGKVTLKMDGEKLPASRLYIKK